MLEENFNHDMALYSDERMPLDILCRNQKEIKALFYALQQAEENIVKKHLAEDVMAKLLIHTLLEEEIFYPAISSEMISSDFMEAVMEMHHAIVMLLSEWVNMQPEDEHYMEKFKVLAEVVRHHFSAEEIELFPKVSGLNIDFAALTEKMEHRKEELESMLFRTMQPFVKEWRH